MRDAVRTRTRRLRPAVLAQVVAGLVALPLVVAIASLVGYHWRPSSDLALEVLRIEDVASRHSPLVGVQSRFGYFHPGPLLFWVLAPFDWVLGSVGILVGTALINATAAVGAVFVGWRRGGAAFATFVGLAALLLFRGLGAAELITPWNPWVTVMPLLLFVLLAWSVAEEDWIALPWLVAIGTFVVQAHVGCFPIVAGLGATASAFGALRHRRARRSDRDPHTIEGPARGLSLRRSLVITGVVATALWLAPVVQQVTGDPGNIAALIDAFRDPTKPSVGWEYSLGIMGRQLGPIPAFVSGDHANAFGFLAESSPWPAIALLLCTATLGALAWRRGVRSAVTLATLAVAGAIIAVIATTRIVGVPAPYLVLWSWVVASLVWLSVFWSLWSLVSTPALRRGTLAVAGAAVVVVSIGVTSTAVGGRPDQHQLSDAIGSIGRQASEQLDREPRYLLSWVDEQMYGSAGFGLLLELEERGMNTRVAPSLAQEVGSWRTARRRDVDQELVLASGYDFEKGWQPRPDATLFATFDPLTRSERARSQRLERRLRAAVGRRVPDGPIDVRDARSREVLVADGADAETVDSLGRLQREGDRYYLYVQNV